MDEVFEPEPKKSKKKNSKGEFHCSDCEYVATRAYHLKTHVESKHEGVRYPCLQCEYAATTAGQLKIHVESKHEGVRYPCAQCNYLTTTASYLKTHVAFKHKGVGYPCLQCDLAATTEKSNKTCSDCRNTGQKKIFLNDILSRKENVILQINNQERRNNKYSILHVAEVEYKNVNLT